MSLYIKETGENNDETIVFLHGDGIAGWMWDEQLKAFSDYHCIIPDLPGHGKSAEVKPVTVQDTADKIIDIIKNKAKNGKAHIVGLSMGAQITVQILSTAPEVVNHVLISGALVRSSQPTESFLELLDNLIALYLPDKNKIIRIMSYVRSYNIPRNLIDKFRESTYVIEPYYLDKILRETILFKMPDNLEHADVPVLVMAGEKDYRIINESALNLLNVLPNSKGAIVLKVGHLWNIENPEMFNNVLRAWISDEDLSNISLIEF
ncbi:alpha/beta fold hydrolase [Methanobacterium sp. MBAC-LM]|uniref:alpha/beta fold hydrolase n=1 Tax=Methanobacterium sp. MBAC-LM TaxID=3412034 RepID=UPI003C77E052